MPNSKEITFRGRQYTVTYDTRRNILIIINPRGEAIETARDSEFAYRVCTDGSRKQILLEADAHAEFFIELIEAAWEAKPATDEEKFFEAATSSYEEDIEHLKGTLNIAVIGKVSSGKSSLINALLMRSRYNPLAEVGVEAGVTTKLRVFRLDEHVRLVDSPGIDDIKKDNSEITKEFIGNIDLGILVVTDAANESQKLIYDNLRHECGMVFVALNKVDLYDCYAEGALARVISQWCECLNIAKLYPICTFGYDPDLPSSTELNLRGIDELRKDIEAFLETKQKKLLLARHMSEKRSYAKGIIATAIAAVGVQAALPGKAAFITATQLTAIASLHYLYKGSVLSKSSAWAVLPVFAGQAVATNVFLFFTSFLPPTGVVEVAAAVTAISITSAMLLAVNFTLSNGFDLQDVDLLTSKFREYKDTISRATRIRSPGDLKHLNIEHLLKELL